MSDSKIRRFTRFQIIFHWMIAVPYMTLLISGGLLILHRLGLLDLVPAAQLSRVHRWMGIALVAIVVQMFLSAATSGRLGLILGDLWHWMRFGWHDLLWLLMIPLNAVLPSRFAAPPAGRFNAGQKLHGLFIMGGIGTFAVTGIWIMLRPSDVRPWLIHSWLFFGAVGFLLLHLFLGLVNPPTRKALGGIFTGLVSRSYLEGHHPLTLDTQATHAKPHAIVSLPAMVVTGMALAGAAVALAWHIGPHRVAARTTQLVKLDHPMISPGPLAAAHAGDARTANCATCHESLRPPTDKACLACHEPIRTVMQNHTGYHGQLQGHCRNCHADHRGRQTDLRGLDTRTFNHHLARFDLHGRHRTLQCDQCHLRHSGVAGQRRFIGLSFAACTSCHASPHDDPKTTDCTRCHNERGWTGENLAFNHQRDAGFALEGKHAALHCDQCHSPQRAETAHVVAASQGGLHAIRAPAASPAPPKPGSAAFQMLHIGQSCADCHVDPHQPTLGTDCRRCHTTAGWESRSLIFEHNRDTRFRLEGAHAQLNCQQCHKAPSDAAPLALASFANTPANCASCHNDPHRGQLGNSCTKCHTQTQWTGRQLLFSHNRDTHFALKGQHAQLACVQCHKPPVGSSTLALAKLAGTPTDCSKCHQDPHAGQFEQSCTKCHTEQGWKGTNLLFSHNRDAKFKIDALHSAVACASCHKPQNQVIAFRTAPASCEQCHAPVADALAGRIAQAEFPTDPHAGRVRCIDCHNPAAREPQLAEMAQACVKCHNPRYRNLLFDWQRSLQTRTAEAQDVVKRLEAGESKQAAAVGQRIAAARLAGFHNTAAAVKLLDDILHPAAPRKTSSPAQINHPSR